MPEVTTAVHAAERRRMDALRGYAVLDTPAETAFDDIAVLAAQLCGTPIALVTLVDTDRQWFKARVGLDVCQTSRESSFCAHAMYGDSVMQVPDARADSRFADNPLVLGHPHIRFYAGAPLVSPGGEPLGSLCVIDSKPGLLTQQQSQGLTVLARHVVAELELRRHAEAAEAANQRLREANRIKDEFVARVTHELRTPLTSISGYLEVIEDGLPASASAAFLDRIRRNCDRLTSLVDDMLLVAQLNAGAITLDRRAVDLAALARQAAGQHAPAAAGKGLALTVEDAGPLLAHADARRITQVVDRLLVNAIKFTPEGAITVRAYAGERGAVLEVRDTGVGFPADEAPALLAAFGRGAGAERAEVQGVGLGLSIVKAVVEGHGGTVELHSVPGDGTTATVMLPATRSPGPARTS